MARKQKKPNTAQVGAPRLATLRPAAVTTEAGYPSVSAHRASRQAAPGPRLMPTRRTFLRGGLLLAGAGALATACDGLFSGQVDGGVSQPDYYSLRFPASPSERDVWLADGTHVRFYVQALTYEEDVAFFVDNQREALTGLIADDLSASTFDNLSSPNGLAAAEVRITNLLDQAYNDDVGDTGDGWFQEVQLYLSAAEEL